MFFRGGKRYYPYPPIPTGLEGVLAIAISSSLYDYYKEVHNNCVAGEIDKGITQKC